MNNVQFQDQRNVYTAPKKKGLEQMIIKMGLAKDSKGAQIVLLVIAVVAILIGGFFAFGGGTGSNVVPNIPAAGPAGL